MMTPRRPESAEIEFKGYRFLITDRPSDSTIERYIDVSVMQHSSDILVKFLVKGLRDSANIRSTNSYSMFTCYNHFTIMKSNFV